MRRQLGRDATAQLVSALVRIQLGYCNAVLAGLPAVMLRPLRRVTSAAAQLIGLVDLMPRDQVTAALKLLLRLPIEHHNLYRLCHLHGTPHDQ